MGKLQRHHVEVAVTLLRRGIFKDIGLPELLEFLTNAGIVRANILNYWALSWPK